MKGQLPRISVIIPVRDEQDSLEPLVDSLRAVLGSSYELIFVDDGSTDQTRKRLKKLHEPGRVRVLRLKKPYGKTAALMAGLAGSRGEIVFTMDGDLQDDPAEIPRFVEQLDLGYDLVCGWKKKRRDPIAKIVASRIFNLATRRLTGLALHDVNCGFKAFRGNVARSLQLYGEMHRFIPVLVAAAGYRVGEIEVTHHPRRHGRSKYGFSRLLKGLLDLITVVLVTRFRERPAHGFGAAGLGFLTLSAVVLGLHLLYSSLLLVLLAMTLALGTIILIAAGWVSEIIVAQRPTSERLPNYSIEEQLD